MKYTFTIIEPFDPTIPVISREKIVLESRAGESDKHIVLKILAYLLYRDPTNGLPLTIERRVGQRHKPDLVTTEPETEHVLLWIDCGQIETKRLGRIAAGNPRAEIIIVKATANEARLYALAAAKHLPTLGQGTAAASVRYLGFDEGFVAGLMASLRGLNTIRFQREKNDTLRLTLNDDDFETALFVQNG